MEEYRVVRNCNKLSSISDDLKEKNIDFEFLPLLCRITEAHSVVARNLRIPLASKVLEIKRMRIVAGVPKTIERIVIPYTKVKGLQFKALTHMSLSTILEKDYGILPIRCDEEVSLVAPTDEEIEMFSLNKDDELLMIKGVSYAADTEPFEYYEKICVTDFFCFRSRHDYE